MDLPSGVGLYGMASYTNISTQNSESHRAEQLFSPESPRRACTVKIANYDQVCRPSIDAVDRLHDLFARCLQRARVERLRTGRDKDPLNLLRVLSRR